MQSQAALKSHVASDASSLAASDPVGPASQEKKKPKKGKKKKGKKTKKPSPGMKDPSGAAGGGSDKLSDSEGLELDSLEDSDEDSPSLAVIEKRRKLKAECGRNPMAPPPLQRKPLGREYGGLGVKTERISSGPEPGINRETIREFWLGLGDRERKELIRVEREAMLKQLREEQKYACTCNVCGRRRLVIEQELEILYDAYFDELEKYGQNAKLNKMGAAATTIPAVALPEIPALLSPPNVLPLSGASLTTFLPPTINNQDGSEVTVDDLASLARSMGDPAEFVKDLDSLPTQVDLMNIAGDLLENDGKKFLEIMGGLTEKKDILGFAPPKRPNPASNGKDNDVLHSDDDSQEFEEDEEGDDDDDDDDDDNDLEEDDMIDSDDSLDFVDDHLEHKMEESRKFFHMFATNMLEQRVLAAYREKVALEKQRELIEEEERGKKQREKRAKKKAQKAKKSSQPKADPNKKYANSDESPEEESEEEVEVPVVVPAPVPILATKSTKPQIPAKSPVKSEKSQPFAAQSPSKPTTQQPGSRSKQPTATTTTPRPNLPSSPQTSKLQPAPQPNPSAKKTAPLPPAPRIPNPKSLAQPPSKVAAAAAPAPKPHAPTLPKPATTISFPPAAAPISKGNPWNVTKPVNPPQQQQQQAKVQSTTGLVSTPALPSDVTKANQPKSTPNQASPATTPSQQQGSSVLHTLESQWQLKDPQIQPLPAAPSPSLDSVRFFPAQPTVVPGVSYFGAAQPPTHWGYGLPQTQVQPSSQPMTRFQPSNSIDDDDELNSLPEIPFHYDEELRSHSSSEPEELAYVGLPPTSRYSDILRQSPSLFSTPLFGENVGQSASSLWSMPPANGTQFHQPYHSAQ